MCAALGCNACPCYEDVSDLPKLPDARNVFDCAFASLLCEYELPCVFLYVFPLLFVFVGREMFLCSLFYLELSDCAVGIHVCAPCYLLLLNTDEILDESCLRGWIFNFVFVNFCNAPCADDFGRLGRF